MTTAVERFLAAARALGMDPEVHRFPQGTKTAQDAADAIGCQVGQIVKSLVFMADESPVMAFTSGVNRVDPAKLAVAVGAAAVRRATPEEARTATGFAVGGTPPFGHPTRVPAVMDRDLLGWEEVWAAAGTPDSVFPVQPARLLAATDARPVDLAES
jgi:prolyl-tRNA editing enzyme YbaK/EbsC (Cys-tRNA(Pro) deacylase)